MRVSGASYSNTRLLATCGHQPVRLTRLGHALWVASPLAPPMPMAGAVACRALPVPPGRVATHVATHVHLVDEGARLPRASSRHLPPPRACNL